MRTDRFREHAGQDLIPDSGIRFSPAMVCLCDFDESEGRKISVISV